MKEKINITNISFDSLFKIFFFGTFPVIMGFCLLASMAVIIQGVPENPAPNQLYGWQAFMAAIFLGVAWPFIVGLLFAASGKLGLFAVFKFKKSLMLEVVIAEPKEGNSAANQV